MSRIQIRSCKAAVAAGGKDDEGSSANERKSDSSNGMRGRNRSCFNAAGLGFATFI